MEKELITTSEYLLLIDEEAEIKDGDICIDSTGIIFKHENHFPISIGQRKITAYHPLNSEAKELDLPLLPPFEEQIDLHKLYNEKIRSYPFSYRNSDSYFGFGLGYKAAQSKQLELLKRAVQLASDAENIEEVTQEIIQALSTQQLPKEFIPETEVDPTNPKNWYQDSPSGKYWEDEPLPPNPNNLYTNGTRRLKTITNSKGKEVLVGTWKY